MKTIIRLTECPHCKAPLAAVHPYGEKQGYLIPIDGMVIDLSAHGLIWCNVCGQVLPVPTLAAPQADMAGEGDA